MLAKDIEELQPPKDWPYSHDAWEAAKDSYHWEDMSMSATGSQVGGEHYMNLAIQPMEYSVANNLGPCEHTAIKYLTRWREKGGYVDLEKAKHCIDLLIELDTKY